MVDDGTDEAKLSVDDEQLLHVLQMPVWSSTAFRIICWTLDLSTRNICSPLQARLKTKLENMALAGQDIRLDAQDFAQGAQDAQTSRRDPREQLRQVSRPCCFCVLILTTTS